jgi:hypothetical protein
LQVWDKHDAKQTNKGSAEQFTGQLCQRVYKQSNMSRAQLAMDITSKKMYLDGVKKVSMVPNCDNPNIPDVMFGLPKYKIGTEAISNGERYLSYRVYCKWKSSNMQSSHITLPEA